MTKEQWIEKYSGHLIGLALRGLVFDSDERVKGPFGAGAYALTLPDKVRKLLSAMFDEAKTNGTQGAK